MRLCKVIPFVTSLILVTSWCGCTSVLEPSNRTRYQSYSKSGSLFVANRDAALKQTYAVFSGDSDLEMAIESQIGTTSAVFSFTNAKSVSRALAVAINANGYLITAGHVVKAKTYVLGSVDGRIDLRPARLVYRNDFESPADLAVLKVEGKLDHCLNYGDEPKVGDRVFGVVMYLKKKDTAGKMDFVAGTVVSVTNGPPDSSVTLVGTDVPVRPGDSGGPLLSSMGMFVGIITHTKIDWNGFNRKTRTTCFLPDKGFVQSIIAADRASIEAANQGAAPNSRRDFHERCFYDIQEFPFRSTPASGGCR